METSIDAGVKYGEIFTLSPTPLPSREWGLNFPLPSWDKNAFEAKQRDRGRGGNCAIGFNIFNCRIKNSSVVPPKAGIKVL